MQRTPAIILSVVLYINGRVVVVTNKYDAKTLGFFSLTMNSNCARQLIDRGRTIFPREIMRCLSVY